MENPELEFQKTALAACRSNIAQQEAEIKRLNECLVIRNKRILQLESQIGHASEFIAARDTSNENTPDVPLQTVLSKLEYIENKLKTEHAATHSNNIVINSCQHDHPTLKQRSSIMTQTDLTRIDEPTAMDETDEEPANDFSDEPDESQATVSNPTSL